MSLYSTAIFKDLSPDDLDYLTYVLTKKVYDKGTTIIYGDIHRMYEIEAGEAKVDGQEQKLKEKDTFGEGSRLKFKQRQAK